MFHDITPAMLDRMRWLEEKDQRDRSDGTPRSERLRQVPPETGRFLALLAAGTPDGEIIEIGASAGYSTLWLALACRGTGRSVTTFEIDSSKAELARTTFSQAGVEDCVNLIEGDAREHLDKMNDIAFCFLDAEKEDYQHYYDLVIPKIVSGGMLVADNAINHYVTLEPMINLALADRRVDALVVPIGKGELVCRRI